MCPETFTDHKISNSVSIKISHIKGVRLRKFYSVAVLFRLCIDEAMHLEFNSTVDFNVFEPGNTEPMRGNCCYDIVVAVIIHVVDKHLSPIKLKRPFVMFP